MNRQPPGVGPTTNHSMHSAYYTSAVTTTNSGDMPAYSSSVSGVSSSASRHGNSNEKGAIFANESAAHSRTAPQERTVFMASSTDPFVQTDNRLSEEYSRRIHCYISDTQGDSSTPRDHMPPPVLPPFASLHSEQEMPFWRPPRVLQRDPHYNQAVAYHSHLLPHSSPPPTEHAAIRRLALSPNHRAYGSYSQCRPTAPPSSADQSIVIDRTQRMCDLQRPSEGHISASEHLIHGIASNPAIIVSSIPSSTDRSSQRKPNHTSWRMCNADSPAALIRNSTYGAHSLTSDSLATNVSLSIAASRHYIADDENSESAAADYSSSNSNDTDVAAINGSVNCDELHLSEGFPALAKSSELRLPPINHNHTAAHEPMSIACLVDAEDTTAALATRRLSYHANALPSTPASSLELPAGSVVLPQISNLVSIDGSTSRHMSALALSQLRRSTGSHHSTQQTHVHPISPRKRSYGATEAAMSLHKMARVEARPLSMDITTSASPQPAIASWSDPSASLDAPNLVVITCYHASVAQKSYGGEKRFLCPPPAVLMRGEGCSARVAHHSPMLLSVITDANVAINLASPPELSICKSSQPSKAARKDDAGSGGASSGSECGNANAQSSSSAHAPLECQTSFNERNVALFKSLHVTGMQKAKSFRLRLDLLAPSAPCEQPYTQEPRPLLKSQVYASLESDPVAIISKPSKKTAKARNQSTCIRAGSLISLFNRINSQTFRTKYLNVDHLSNRWVAQSHNWSPLEVVVLAHRDGSSPAQSVPEASDSRPLYYGSEIVLVESRRSFRSPPMIIHKVERGRYVENACSPVSQMQKVALQLKPMAPGEPPRFLKADAGHYGPTADASAHVRFDDPDGSPELTFETLNDASTADNQHCEPSLGEDAIPELDDAFCWTIVGISAFTYSYSLPYEQPQPLCCINTIPRVFHAWVVDNSLVHIRVQSLDLSTMQLVLGDQPLEVEYCSKQSELSKSVESRVKDGPGMASSSSTRSEQGELYAIKLPEDIKVSGSLSIRRADGVVYHTKWSIRQQEGAPRALEVVALKLDI